ncbi:MAG: heme lyase CcmF/NrfE family subunit [candidate division NC10 bacterium]|nr:heme lyase CcmF/NrfE family subunit [candidate division NC10 bacterium]
MNDIGYLSLVIAFGVAAYATLAPILGVKTGREELVRSAENALLALFGLVTLSSAALLYAFVTRDFSVRYVANYSERGLPLAYTISAFYAGQEGSLLFWTLNLTLFGTIVVIQNRRMHRALMPYVISILSAVALFFLTLMVFVTDPFARLPFTPPDGRGLNPLLQNPGMFFHPPTTYLGYVGFTVPFAFAMAALLARQLDDAWIRSTRRWTIFAWFFLGLGNMFGAEWAYGVLGWGGYWGWDPVENASFRPWLTGTAYLHSVMVQEKKDMLKVWNLALIIMTFGLSILGTFLTRSGILSSVHSFGESTLGAFFLAFLAVIILGAFGLLINRLPYLRSENQLDSFISRESSFLFNNLFLVGIAFTVLWGTFFPILSEGVRGVKITVGPPFYNQVVIPIGLALIFITGVCPLIAWRKASMTNLKKNFLQPLVTALVGGALLFIFGVRHLLALLSLALLIFVTATIVLEFYRGTRARHEMAGEGYLRAFFILIARNKRRYGGYIIHLGVLMVILAITGGAYKVEKEATLKKGEEMQINQYVLRYEGLSLYPTQTQQVAAATVTVFNQGKKVGKLTTEKVFHKDEQQPHTRVAIRMTLKEDLYIILAGFDESGTATFRFIINPLMVWMWLGGFVMALGTIIVMWPDKRERRRAARYALGEAPDAV